MPYLLAVLIFAAVVAVCASPPSLRLSRAVALMAARVGRHGFVSICLVFLVALISMALPSILGSMPVPSIHDEFGYLLTADTLAHLRLTNPTHAMWPYLETFHVFHQPTYTAKFPPGQGLALAAGQVLGHPIIGAWLSVSLACAATTWMLRAWVPPRWAVLGGLLAAAHQTIHWFSQNYWGGGVAMLGGALFGGGAARAMSRPRASAAAWMGLGMAILANSRPFEGLITALFVALFVAIVVVRRHGLLPLLLRIGIPVLIVLLPCVGAMGYYNWRVTRSALTLPYAVHERQYMAAPLFYFQRTPPVPAYRHEQMRQFHLLGAGAEWQQHRTFDGFLKITRENIDTLARAYGRPLPLVVPLVVGVLTMRRPLNRLLLLVCIGLPVLHMSLSPWMRIQYMAPALPFFIALIVVGLHRLERLRVGRLSIGAAIVAAVLLVHTYTAVSFAVTYNRRPPPPPGRERAEFVQGLSQQPGKHLVIVRYSPAHAPTVEWVFNTADIDSSKIVFAREIDPDGDRPLLEYFADRHVWILDLDGPNFRITKLR